jgi:hypothetical protein
MADAVINIKGNDQTQAAFLAVKKALSEMSANAKAAGASFSSVFGAFSAVLSVGSIIEFGRSVVNLGGQINDLSVQANLSTDSFQALSNIGRDSGVDFEMIAKSSENLRSKIQDAVSGNKEAIASFSKLNVTAQELKAIGLEKAWSVIGIKIREATDKSEAFNAVSDIFGAKIAPKLKQVFDELGKSNLEDLGKKFKDLTLSPSQLKALDDFGDKTAANTQRLKAFAAQLALNFIEYKAVSAAQTGLVLFPQIGKIKGLAEEKAPAKDIMAAIAAKEQIALIDEQTKATMTLARAETERAARSLAYDEAQKSLREGRTAGMKAFLKADEDAFDVLIKKQKEDNDSTAKLREQNEKLASTFKDLGNPMRSFQRDLLEIDRLQKDGKLTAEESAKAIAQINDEILAFNTSSGMKFQTDQMETFRDIAMKSGEIVSQSFENAIFSGKKLGEVLKSLVLDFTRMIFAQTVTKSLASSVAGIFGVLPSARASGGPVNSGSPYLVGEKGPELFVPSSSGSIVSNSKMNTGSGSSAGGSGGVTVNYAIAAGVSRAELVPILESERKRLKAEIPDMVRRGGAYRTAFA